MAHVETCRGRCGEPGGDFRRFQTIVAAPLPRFFDHRRREVDAQQVPGEGLRTTLLNKPVPQPSSSTSRPSRPAKAVRKAEFNSSGARKSKSPHMLSS